MAGKEGGGSAIGPGQSAGLSNFVRHLLHLSFFFIKCFFFYIHISSLRFILSCAAFTHDCVSFCISIIVHTASFLHYTLQDVLCRPITYCLLFLSRNLSITLHVHKEL